MGRKGAEMRPTCLIAVATAVVLGFSACRREAERGSPAAAPEPGGGRPLTHRQIAGPLDLKATADRLKHTIVTPHLEQQIKGDKNVLWCATAQIAWNELCRLAGGEIHLEDEPPMVALLNKRAASREDLDPASYVAMAGVVGDGILSKIEMALREKFAGQASVELAPAPRALPADFWVAYAYLFKQLPFAWAFTRFDSSRLTFDNTEVVSFGISQFLPSQENEARMASQVAVLDHRNNDDFIIELKTRSKEDRLVLAKVPPAGTLRETIEEVRRRSAGSRAGKMESCEDLFIPVLNFDVMREYSEVYGRRITAKNPRVDGTEIVIAKQRIRFKLDETGAVLASESVWAGGLVPRSLIFDKPFLILLERRGAANPYFALWVANAELLVPSENSTNTGEDD